MPRIIYYLLYIIVTVLAIAGTHYWCVLNELGEVKWVGLTLLALNMLFGMMWLSSLKSGARMWISGGISMGLLIVYLFFDIRPQFDGEELAFAGNLPGLIYFGLAIGMWELVFEWMEKEQRQESERP